METSRIVIFDTTLRDGEQSPGCSMNTAEKLKVAHALAELGVDIIEAGFPIASPGDFEAVRAIAEAVRGATVCGLARCRPDDIDRAAEALEPAGHKRIHVFLATSAIHREHKLKMTKDQIIEHAVAGVKRAKGYCDDIEFSPEDAARTERQFLAEVVTAAIDAGATTVNIPDTVGYTVPERFGEVITHLRQDVSNIDQAVISVHCHNDLGLAVANSLAAVTAGARQIECTVNGLGERAGNASLEEVVMALKVRQDHFALATGINTRKLYPASRLVSTITGMRVQRNKAIVGRNAFAHEAGIHQDGILKNPATYEIMRPEDVGFTHHDLVLGKHSGRHAFRQRVTQLGFVLSDEQLQDVFEQFKALADKKKEIYDLDIEALIEEKLHAVPDVWQMVSMQVVSGSSTTPTATVTLRQVDDGQVCDAATGDGPVDAAFNAIDRIVGLAPALCDYQVRSVSVGQDAQGEVTIEVEHDGATFRGRAVSTDIIDASARAYLQAINKLTISRKTPAPPGDAAPTL